MMQNNHGKYAKCLGIVSKDVAIKTICSEIRIPILAIITSAHMIKQRFDNKIARLIYSAYNSIKFVSTC